MDWIFQSSRLPFGLLGYDTISVDGIGGFSVGTDTDALQYLSGLTAEERNMLASSLANCKEVQTDLSKDPKTPDINTGACDIRTF